MKTIYALRTKNFCYVGCSANMRLRKYWHRTALKRGKHYHKEMSDDVKEHGKECISFEEIEVCPDIVAPDREQFWIETLLKKERVLNRVNPTDNSWRNKDRLIGARGKKWSEEQRERHSKRMKGHIGRHLSRDESIRMNAMREPHGKQQREACRKLGYASGKSVINLDTGQIYPSGRQAAKAIGSCQQSVSDACRGKIEKLKGHRWSYHK